MMKKLDLNHETSELLTLDELMSLYKATLEKLEECSRYCPSDDLDKDLENSNKEFSQMLLQDRILRYVLKRQITQLSDVQKILNFWKLFTLGPKKTDDYEDSDYLILKSLDYMEAAKL